MLFIVDKQAFPNTGGPPPKTYKSIAEKPTFGDPRKCKKRFATDN